MLKRACASKIGEFCAENEKTYVYDYLIPAYKMLFQEDQDQIRILCLESLVPLCKKYGLSDKSIQGFILSRLIESGQDKSWKVKLAFSKNFANFANTLKEITDAKLIQTLSFLLQDTEPEVRNVAIENLSECLQSISQDKI
jgi:serine/threonine-protein phosphatase 2A regulatory subunit A